jgi:hypothetical protein
MSGYERGHVLEAASGLLITRAGLLVAGFRRWKTAVEWLTPVTLSDGAAEQLRIDFARALERRVSAAARHLPLVTNCLDQSMTLWWMLRRRGIAGELRIGARKEETRFEAHAWVELGAAFLDTSGGGRDFTRFGPALIATETQGR